MKIHNIQLKKYNNKDQLTTKAPKNLSVQLSTLPKEPRVKKKAYNLRCIIEMTKYK